ncbi:MAG: dTDP-4-dehydrorhamnose reductase [Planctomycetota bacterium]
MTTLVTGARGMLGQVVVSLGDSRGIDRAEGDLADGLPLDATISGVIHCAGYTDVDGAEADPEAARRGNVETTRVVATACAERDLPLVVVSTDYVFDGRAERPYVETDATNPLGVYARTKAEAEAVALDRHPGGTRIVRTAWLYGPGGRNFPDTMLALADRPLRVVDDQCGSPTSTAALAPVLHECLELPAGIYHAACEGACSWYELAAATFAIAGIEADLSPCTTAEYPRPAPRPARSVLDCSRLAALRGQALPHWRDALATHLARPRA